MTTIFENMMKADMPEHLVLRIAEGVHHILAKDAMSEISKMYGPFEQLCRDNEPNAVLKELRKEYPNMKVCIDEFVDWLTLILKLDESKFILFHNYIEAPTNDILLIEGSVNSKGEYAFDRFYYKSQYREWTAVIEDAKEYFGLNWRASNEGSNYIPFQFLDKVMTDRSGCAKDVDKYMRVETLSKWHCPKSVIQWFYEADDIWLSSYR